MMIALKNGLKWLLKQIRGLKLWTTKIVASGVFPGLMEIDFR
jgi:hypothetical protein